MILKLLFMSDLLLSVIYINNAKHIKKDINKDLMLVA